MITVGQPVDPETLARQKQQLELVNLSLTNMVRTQTQAMLKSQPKDRQIIEQEANKVTLMQK